MSGKHDGNQHKAHECPYCWLVLYSQGALTKHINDEHWREVEELKQAAVDATMAKPESEFITVIEGEQ